MTLIWLTVVVGLFNICLGFALGVYMQGKRQATSGNDPGSELSALDDFSRYRSFGEDLTQSSDEPQAGDGA